MVYMASKITRRILGVCCLLWMTGNLQAQSNRRPFHQEAAFIRYLQDKELYGDALVALNELDPGKLDPIERDSVSYLKGWSFYNLKHLDSSAFYLARVRPGSALFVKSGFFGAYNNIYLGRYDRAKAVLDRIPAIGDTAEIVRFERAGMALLQKDYDAFDSLHQDFSYNLYALSAQEQHFQDYEQQLRNLKHKSPLVAGVLSAVIPGAGKVYAGKLYQGIATLFPMAALALLTNESYHKRGPNSAEFYVFGSLLTVFYVGNIWGSVFSVKIKRREDENLVDQKVLLDLQIPLRTIFN